MPQVASERDGLDRVTVRLVTAEELGRFNHHLQEDHYLASRRLAGQALRYVAERDGQWVALLTFSAPALHLKAREQWIGWTPRQRARRIATGRPCWPACATWPTALMNCRRSGSGPGPTRSTPGARNKPSPRSRPSSISDPLAQAGTTLWGCGRPDPARRTPRAGPHTARESAGRRTGYPRPRHADFRTGLGQPAEAQATPPHAQN